MSASCQLTQCCSTGPEVHVTHDVSMSLHWHVGKPSMAVTTCAIHQTVSQWPSAPLQEEQSELLAHQILHQENVNVL